VRVIASVPRAERICSVSGSRTWSRPSCSTRFAEIAPYHELIDEMLKTNTVTTVHQRLRDERGLG
jgi:hypothetical protein